MLLLLSYKTLTLTFNSSLGKPLIHAKLVQVVYVLTLIPHF